MTILKPYFFILMLLTWVSTVFSMDLNENEAGAKAKTQLQDEFWFPGDDALKVVQNRYFKKEKRVEITFFNAGYFLKNQYIDIISLGGGVTFYFSEMWAWEIVSGHFTFTRERTEVKDLRKFSFNKTGVEISADIRKPKYIITSNILWIPMYGKYSLMESQFIYYDTYFLAGAGIIKVEGKTKPVINIGLGQKYFVTRNWLVRVDLKDHFYEDTVFGQKGLRDKIVLSLGISYVW